ncbi:WXG100 family type VII secretion target [Serinibacter arcticus]|uniref:WXG100 family type VII secretion target n=1 Tax=Serinibacter arcticus TaxID=1655435 RepID=UPI0018EEB99D|nr:hypothetical protein [Serinibacter arcticus]
MSLFTRPDGSPEVLRSTAADQRRVHTTTETAAADLRREGGSLGDVWEGDSSLVAVTSLNGLATLVEELSGAAQRASAAIDTYATALETFQDEVDDLNARHATALARYQRRPNPPTTPEESVEAQDEVTVFDTAVLGLWEEYHDAKDTFEDAALALVQVIDADMPPHVPEHAEGINDYLQGLMIDWMQEVPILQDFHQLVEAGMNLAPVPAAALSVYTNISKIVDHVRTGTPLTSNGIFGRFLDTKLKIPPAFLNGMATGSVSGPLSRLLMGAPVSVNGVLTASRTQSLLTLARGNTALGTVGNVGMLRGLGIVGGVASTGLSLANVISQGNPVDAFRANGTEYVQDIAEVGFNASLTAAMIAPNPVTIGAAAVTGVIYGGLAVWNNREAIADGIGEAWDATTDFVDDVGDAIGDAAENVGDAIGDAVSSLNPFD